MASYTGSRQRASSNTKETAPPQDRAPPQDIGCPTEITPVSVTLNTHTLEDDGKFSSDTATRNSMYIPVYKYSPPIERAFPVEEGGPQPYLNNFDRIGR
jgi:hypothetical protein